MRYLGKIGLGVVTLLVIFQASSLNAQKGWEVGGYLGLGHYFGDLNTNYSLNDPGPAAGLLYRRNFNERISFTTGIHFTRLKAFDNDSNNAFQQMRNLSFKSNVFDANLALEFNFFTYIHGDRDYYYTPYATFGIAVTKFNPKAELDGQSYALRDLGTEGQGNDEYGLISPALFFGIGYKWDISYKWSMNVSLIARRLQTDYLDDVSTTYPDLLTLSGTDGSLAAALSDRSGIEGFATEGKQRGNSKNNDTYVIVGVSIMRFFSRLECPKVSRIKAF